MSSSDISITRLSASDPLIACTLEFAKKAYTTLFSHLTLRGAVPPDLTSFYPTYVDPSSGGCFLAAHRETEVVAIIGFRPYLRRFINSSGALRESLQWDGKRLVEVVRLFVDPSHRRKGLASELIDRLVKEAVNDELDGLYLHTHPFLPSAQSLWEKNGWNFVEQDEDGVWDTIHMIRWLDEKPCSCEQQGIPMNDQKPHSLMGVQSGLILC
jgi:GNAT superfamily N-acetyltransferase